MFSFNFASKMLNTIMGTEEQQGQQQGGGPPQQTMGGPGQPGMRPMGPGGFSPGGMRPQGGPVGSPRPGFPGPPTFSGPRPSPGARAGPPSFGGPPRPTIGGGTPHRFNGPQPPPQQQPPMGQMGQMQMQQGPQQMGARGMSPIPGGGSRAPSPGPSRPRGPGPSMGGGPQQQQQQQQQMLQRPPPVAAVSGTAPVPEVDLSHLSAEERAMIENVMAKAQQLEGVPPTSSSANISQPLQQQQQLQRMQRSEAQHQQQQQQMGMDMAMRMCPLCRQRDVSGKMDGIPGQECQECRTIVCNRCGGMTSHPETKRQEWTCGNCINNRRQRMAGHFPPQQQPQQHNVASPHQQPQTGPRPYGQQQIQQPHPMDADGVRRGSGGGLHHQNEREFESKEKLSRRRPSFEEIFSPEKSEHSEEPLHESPLDVDLSFPIDPSFPDQSQCMSTPHTASASQAKPSFVISNNKLHSRSVSIEMSEKPPDNIVISPPHNGFEYFSTHYDEEESFREPEPSTSFQMEPLYPIPQLQPPQPPQIPQPPPVDEKTSALMEELAKLQSAVGSTLKRRQRQKEEGTADDEELGRSSFRTIRSPSPSPSPSPIGESPLYSPPKQHKLFSPEKISPESPDVPGPRKAIVLKDHDLDDYKDSSEEESPGSDDSDEGRKGVASGDVYYDHSPGEVYTIPEADDEGGSPTGSDLVTSLKKQRQGVGFQPTGAGSDMGTPRRRGQDMLHATGGGDPRQQPQLRPQRSLDNRLPSTQPPPHDMSTHQSIDQQGNLYATNNNVNTQSLMHPNLGQLDSIGQDLSMGQQTSSQSSAMINTGMGSSSLQQHGQQNSDQFHLQQQQSQQRQQQQQGLFGQTMSGLDDPHRSMQQQVGQLATDSSQLSGLNEWSGGNAQSSIVGPTVSVSTSLTGQHMSSSIQSYQQLPSSSTYSSIPSSSVPTTTSSQQFQQQQQGFPQQFPGSPSQIQAPQSLYPQQQPSAAAVPLQSSPQQQFPSIQDPLLNQSQNQPSLQNQMTTAQMQQQQQQPLSAAGCPLQGSQLQQLQAQQAQAQQLAQQQTWLSQSDQQQQQFQQQPLQQQTTPQGQQQQNVYDQSGRLLSSPGLPQFPQNQQTPSLASHLQTQDPYQLMQQQQHNLGGSTASGAAAGQVAGQTGPQGAKSISGLLADFSRALGLGSTSPRPSPSEDKSLAFPSSLGAMQTQVQPLSPYDSYQTQQPITTLPQSQSISQHQHSAFAPIGDSYQRQNQQLSYLSQPTQQQTGLQNQYGGTVSQSQSFSGPLTSPQSYQVMSQGGLQQQSSGAVGVGVIGALSPAQAHMYQQQMAMQHQQQHMKKRGRGGTSGDIRRDGSGQQSAILIGGQGLAVTPSGMTIGALTPAVVTSLGTFIGGSPAIQLIPQGGLGASQGFGGWTPVGTPRSGREPPGGGDSSDTMSETDSQKSLRMRRKLPLLPPDQEAAPLPSTKKRERHRSHQEHFRSISPLRTADGMVAGRQYPFSSLSLSRPSASESNLRKISMNVADQIPRPGSALGLLQASSVVSSTGGKPDISYPLSSSLFSTSSGTFPGLRAGVGYPGDMTTTTTSVLAGLYPSHKSTQDSWNANLAELAACLPPDLRHLLNKGNTGSIEHEFSGIGGLMGETSSSLNSGTQLPSYIRSLREQLQEERRQLLSEERRRLEQLRERDRELGARLDAVTSRAGSDGLRSRTELGISRSAGASPLLSSRKLKTHRRQLSDPKLSLPFSPIAEDGDSELQDFERVSTSLLRPYKSYEYESLEDAALLHQRQANKPQFDWDHSQSYLASSWAAAGGVLRETAINSMGLSEQEQLSSSRYLSRRNSEGEPSSFSTSRHLSSSVSGRDRRHHMRKHRKSRSWHPSPYVSEEEEEEEEDLLSREEKKARIKAEIARRRQQMQERGGSGGGGIRSDFNRLCDLTDQEKHSVLKSVDQLIRDQQYGGRYDSAGPSTYGRYLMYSGMGAIGGGAMGGPTLTSYGGRLHHHHHHSSSGVIVSPCASEEDRSIERIASTFRPMNDELSYYERLGEMSPMATDSESMGSELGAPAAMPILPDMPTRSRRLLEDLGSAPIGLNEGGRGSSGQNVKGRRQTPQSMEFHSQIKPTRDEEPKVRDEQIQENVDPNKMYPPNEQILAKRPSPMPKKRVIRLPQIPKEPQPKKSQKTKVTQSSGGKYPFPVKRFLLTRDAKDSSVESNGIGLKVTGGKELPESNGILAAYVSKIFPEKMANSITDINEGDVVMEWNGVSLENKTFEDVNSILRETNMTEEVELVIRSEYNIVTGKKSGSEPLSVSDGGERRRITDAFHSLYTSTENEDSPGGQSSSQEQYGGILESTGHEINAKSLTYENRLVKSPSSSTEATNTSASTSIHQQSGALFEDSGKFSHHLVIPSETDLRKRSTSSLPPSLTKEPVLGDQCGRNISIKGMVSPEIEIKSHTAPKGKIWVQICHDGQASILYVTILKARLPKEKTEEEFDPYVTVFLMPDRLFENQRRTRHIPMTSSPVWNQTMVYPNVTSTDLKEKYLEVSVKNYNPTRDWMDSLFGKVILYLSDPEIVDENFHSYSLRMDEKPHRRKSSQSHLKAQQTGGSNKADSKGRSHLLPHISASLLQLSVRFRKTAFSKPGAKGVGSGNSDTGS